MAQMEGEMCRDCAVTVNPKWSELQFGDSGARIQPDLCTFGFTNCKQEAGTSGDGGYAMGFWILPLLQLLAEGWMGRRELRRLWLHAL